MRFWDAYGIAENIRFAIEENVNDIFLENYIDFSNNLISSRLYKPHRWTLLHQFILRWFYLHSIVDFEHHRDDMLYLIVMEYKKILEGYEIEYPQIVIPEEKNEKYEEIMYPYISELRSHIPIPHIANETFQLLFRDRKFLVEFNLMISEVVSKMTAKEFPDLLKKDGVIKRRSLPSWAKKGVFFRDQGCCISCGINLTGTFMTHEAVHYDHIVPLAKGGTNDPINFQILCSECNLKKSTNISTSYKYPVFWSIKN